MSKKSSVAISSSQCCILLSRCCRWRWRFVCPVAGCRSWCCCYAVVLFMAFFSTSSANRCSSATGGGYVTIPLTVVAPHRTTEVWSQLDCVPCKYDVGRQAVGHGRRFPTQNCGGSRHFLNCMHLLVLKNFSNVVFFHKLISGCVMTAVFRVASSDTMTVMATSLIFLSCRR